jgi:hypothetical protein
MSLGKILIHKKRKYSCLLLPKYHKEEHVELRLSKGQWLVKGAGRTSSIIFIHYCIDKLLSTTYQQSPERHMVLKMSRILP